MKEHEEKKRQMIERWKPMKEKCPVCMENQVVCTLFRCQHAMCTACFSHMVKPAVCPLCRQVALAPLPADVFPSHEEQRELNNLLTRHNTCGPISLNAIPNNNPFVSRIAKPYATHPGDVWTVGTGSDVQFYPMQHVTHRQAENLGLRQEFLTCPIGSAYLTTKGNILSSQMKLLYEELKNLRAAVIEAVKRVLYCTFNPVDGKWRPCLQASHPIDHVQVQDMIHESKSATVRRESREVDRKDVETISTAVESLCTRYPSLRRTHPDLLDSINHFGRSSIQTLDNTLHNTLDREALERGRRLCTWQPAVQSWVPLESSTARDRTFASVPIFKYMTPGDIRKLLTKYKVYNDNIYRVDSLLQSFKTAQDTLDRHFASCKLPKSIRETDKSALYSWLKKNKAITENGHNSRSFQFNELAVAYELHMIKTHQHRLLEAAPPVPFDLTRLVNRAYKRTTSSASYTSTPDPHQKKVKAEKKDEEIKWQTSGSAVRPEEDEVDDNEEEEEEEDN
jgi:hypothetical protein